MSAPAETSPVPMIEIPARPAFGRHLAVEIVAGEGVVLYGERSCVVLPGVLHERLARLVDGTTTSDDIVDQLSEVHPTTEVYYALLRLAEAGHIVEGARTDDAPAAAFWDSLGDVTRSRRQLSAFPVSVLAPHDDDRRAWSAELLAHGFCIEDPGSLTIVVTDDYLSSDLQVWNALALTEKRRWLLCRPAGTRLMLGPLFVPGTSSCWECLRHRLARNHPVLAYLAGRRGGVPGLPRAGAAWSVQTAVGLVATQIARIMIDDAPADLLDRITVLDTISLESSQHLLSRRPQCPACGDPALYARRAGTALTLHEGAKHFTADGGHRVVTPQATLDRLAPLIDPLTGVITELRRVPYDNPWVHVYTSGLNGALAHHDLAGLNAGLRRSSSGKGFTDVQARASALGEAIERHSAIFQGDEPRVRSNLVALGDRAVHPDRCTLYSDAQHRDADRGGADEWVPQRFDAGVEIDWSPIWSLTEQRTKYLPTSFLYLGHRPPVGLLYCLGDSNGNAAGNTIEEAVLQGFLELVERDGTALWWYNRAMRPAIDLDSLDAPGWKEIREFYRTMDRELWLLDISTDLDIPTFVAVSRYAGRAREEILLGLGAHLDPRIAAMRAISEMNQMLAALDSLRDGVGVNATLSWWLRTATLANQPYLAPAPGALKSLSAYPRVEHDDLRDDILWCQRAVEAHGMELLVLDQTRPDIEFPVAKVVVPELRHFRPRFAPGRLYDIPVRLGWLPSPTSEPDLNPAPFFL